ncbi:transporter [Phaeovibrio sulfidiphilus]|uniref:Transporter n=1 Tax=Phaeovibrio sulfidiphilus TaxID=1220600 RepID=A0A8J7CW99_9PROT|nr:transporter [Phaeovibrio sulfidiphilus]MBE1237231.1 transporter [Phaeovibrio sulfidiphilus]
MKRLLLAVVCLSFLHSGPALAGHARYTSGVEGLRVASFPPPGAYWRTYNVLYTANTQVDDAGDRHGMDVDVFAFVNRFIYSSEVEVLGGNWGFDVIVPLTSTSLDAGFPAGRNSRVGMGDILVEPFVLAWHGARWDAALIWGLYLPVGDYKASKPASAGKGYWSSMVSGGGTVYFDAEKTWSASLLARWEHHLTRQRTTKTEIGDDFHFEWGVGKRLTPFFEVGVTGYCEWQLEGDRTRSGSRGDRARAFAVGPELGYTIEPWGLDVTVRSQWEFGNRNATQGNISSLVFTKAF